MHLLTDLAPLRACIAGWKRHGHRIGFVPTMGNLHAGHAALVELARQQADKVVVSIFVNPTQFGPHEDFARYPRTPEADHALLHKLGVDLIWQPGIDTMYPRGRDHAVQVRVPGLTDILEGAHRPGHFDGVTGVVARLFHQVQPDLAVFGRKDYQQLAVIRVMVNDLAIPVAIVPAPTIRAPDGLALSSRNQYLSADERTRAPALYRSLVAVRDAVRAGQPPAQVLARQRTGLETGGFVVDYLDLRTSTLETLGDMAHGNLVALVAARLGNTRLIDNLEFAL